MAGVGGQVPAKCAGSSSSAMALRSASSIRAILRQRSPKATPVSCGISPLLPLRGRQRRCRLQAAEEYADTCPRVLQPAVVPGRGCAPGNRSRRTCAAFPCEPCVPLCRRTPSPPRRTASESPRPRRDAAPPSPRGRSRCTRCRAGPAARPPRAPAAPKGRRWHRSPRRRRRCRCPPASPAGDGLPGALRSRRGAVGARRHALVAPDAPVDGQPIRARGGQRIDEGVGRDIVHLPGVPR